MFPLSGVGGWTWKDEYLAGRAIASAHADEAWIYHTDCACNPFTKVPSYYIKRCEWGKDARGIPLKLGPNSLYGKMAQSKGVDPPFQSWVWAGNITSGTRAQLLRAIGCHRNPWACLMLATDGVWSRERLTLPTPRDTGTGHLPKPLGGWEEKRFDKGVFAVRPGIYFPLSPTLEELEKVRARGLGRKVLYERWREVVAAHEAGATELEITGMSRFIGATSAVTRRTEAGPVKRSPDYGEWVDWPIKVSFQPFPKRRVAAPDGRLLPWTYLDWESEPYDPAAMSPEALAMMLAELMAEEQPDADLAELD
jgi:hypothetical protein